MKKLFLLPITIALLFACQSSDLASPAATDTGVGGSYARFIIVGEFMYVVDEENLITFDISEAEKPVEVDKQVVGERIESIFNFQDKLFIGSGQGLFIYEILASGFPNRLSATNYFEFEIFPCDPVVANEAYAYVTLNAKRRLDNPCGGDFEVNVNLLKIFDITDAENPQLLQEYDMFAPKGVGLDGETLFVCDDTAGLKVYNVSNPFEIERIAHIDNITAFDVIPLGGLLLVVGPDNVYEFDYTDLDNITLISSFTYGD